MIAALLLASVTCLNPDTVPVACIVPRAITCPACGNVSTQRVDITDVYAYYKRLQASDLRLNQSIAEVLAHENNARANDTARLKEEIQQIRATSADMARKVGRDMYVAGYTNALMAVVRALREPAKTCTLCRVYTSQETRLLRNLAVIFERSAQKVGGPLCR